MTECGTEWGFADDCEAVSHTMTPEEWDSWYDVRQATCLMVDITDGIAFGLDEVLEWFDRFEEIDAKKETENVTIS